MIEISALSKRYGDTEVIANLSLTIEPGEIVAFIAPSGAGKSTLMRIVAGLERPSDGGCHLNGEPTVGTLGRVRMAIQDVDVLPWLSVFDNISLAKTRSNLSVDPNELIDRLGLRGFEHNWPSQLSVGMRKRVALGRCLIGEPEVVILDEVFASLDWSTRMATYGLLETSLVRPPTSVLLVTHDLYEAVMLANRVFILTSKPMMLHEIISLSSERVLNFRVRTEQELSAMLTRVRSSFFSLSAI